MFNACTGGRKSSIQSSSRAPGLKRCIVRTLLEDEIIIQLVDKYGPKKWSTIAQHLPGRIGKQCRERHFSLHSWGLVYTFLIFVALLLVLIFRWHNHLNPAINKEAWTQEEEVILIRAHQINGNRWAELTKYLPGRTDNSIKNHWNSSVKKKLDSYIASGLLAQLQGLPLVSHQSHQSVPSASLRAHHSSTTDGAEAEDNSECSQVGCSQTASDMSNTPCQTREDFVLSEESDHGKVQTSSPTASCSIQYCTSIDDITITIPDTPYDFSCPSKYLEESFSRDRGTYKTGHWNFGATGLPNAAPFEFAAESSNTSGNQFVADQNHEIIHSHFHQSTEYNVPALIDDRALVSDVPLHKDATKECNAIVTFPQEGGDRTSSNLSKCSNIIDMDRYRELLSFQSSFRLLGTEGSVALQSYNPLKTTEAEASHCQNISSIPLEVAVGNDGLALSQAQEAVANAGLIHAHNHSASICHNHIDVGLKRADGLESSRLVPVNAFGSETSDGQPSHPVIQQAVECRAEQEGGTLCYEPPRFPSLEIPFFSCDLAQSGTDMLQDYSPLGIRQLMLPSVDTLTPMKLWDSPSSGGTSPDAVLKSAAKTFAHTPSILKKRHRDLLSPLSPFSERRYDKRLGSDPNQGFLCTSRLTKEFSRLDVLLDDQNNATSSLPYDQNNTSSVEGKENICPASTLEEDWIKDNKADSDNGGILEPDATIAAYENYASEAPRGILVERSLSDTQFFTPEGAGPKSGLKSSERPSGGGKSSKNTCEKGAISEAGADKAGAAASPCSLGERRQGNNFAISVQSVAAISTEMVDSLISEVGAENLNIFGGTPSRRSIESPSAWKSPWYFSSFSPGPRIDTDITIEDIGIFMSPGMGSMDAIGLMKQINEQSADAFADAREVLGSETPESILRQRILKSQNRERESNDAVGSQHESRLHLAANIMTERRILDFSECGTPAKSGEKRKSVTAAGLSSPSSCLLKNYR
ncbi:hypothetical protein Cgig2_002145 [Carnegiea gigantea]|uniref:Uncharacterized protein n=1 Tax=Carnegiea gigantea TaxID=171969 RepID=A0A9Q1KWN9_9CARY|nr:hypothetical protein Cgig2_002145 [Carnegiea gigantea]